MYRTDVNSIKTHVLSNSFMIGLVKEFVSFGGKPVEERAISVQKRTHTIKDL
ncbi:MAG: hypothetical protein ACLR6J_10820 [Parabacteroides merdae]